MSGIDGILVSPVSALLATMIFMDYTTDWLWIDLDEENNRFQYFVKLTCHPPPLGGRCIAQNFAHKPMFHFLLSP